MEFYSESKHKSQKSVIVNYVDVVSISVITIIRNAENSKRNFSAGICTFIVTTWNVNTAMKLTTNFHGTQ